MPQRWALTWNHRPRSLDELLEILLKNRAMEPEQVRTDIRDLAPYAAMAGIDEAAMTVARRIEQRGKILLVSDYDCDGITSLAQISCFFREIGYRRFETLIPVRSEGYGLPVRAVEAHSDASLILALDCGTRDVDSIALARRRNIETVVIDHHETPSNGTAPASILVNPKQPGCPSRFKEFSASGLTLLFLTRLRRALPDQMPRPRLGGHYLQLATLGTIADMVPLVEGNRILARQGLASLNASASPPMRRLIEAARLERKTLTAQHLSYHLGPRINAAGRMADAGLAYDLLTCEQEDRGNELCREINRLNGQRQGEERRILDEIRGRLGMVPDGQRTLVMGDVGWPVGLVGIVASKILQEFQLAAVVILSVDPRTSIARGSARAAEGLHLQQAFAQCDDLLLKWGGHQTAAGLTLEARRIDALAARLESTVALYPPALLQTSRPIDACLEPSWVTSELVHALNELEPHGMGNPRPAFLFRNVAVQAKGSFGPLRSHLRVTLDHRAQGIVWCGAENPGHSRWLDGNPRDVVAQLAWDDYRHEPYCDIKAVGKLDSKGVFRPMED